MYVPAYAVVVELLKKSVVRDLIKRFSEVHDDDISLLRSVQVLGYVVDEGG
jgi:hypothetical protein